MVLFSPLTTQWRDQIGNFMAETLSFQERSLTQQGYIYTKAELRKLEWGLRFTPLACMAGAAYGLYMQSPTIHFIMALVGILPFWFPAWHPMDRFYNLVLRPLVKGVKLPPNPLPRRIACMIGGVMNVGIGVGFLYHMPVAAYVFGAILVPLQLIVISTHFCVAAWLYEMAMKVVGKWDPLIPIEKAQQLLDNGALLIDVRSAQEFAQGHLPNAINIPLDEVVQHIETFREKPTLMYCQSGTRCQSAINQLKRHGLSDIYSLGSMDRWKGAQS
jgi:rhodanese-related sulfurtransferase